MWYIYTTICQIGIWAQPKNQNNERNINLNRLRKENKHVIAKRYKIIPIQSSV